jgi:NAD(P)-dependent dehydrogenase (short-subunit alcohol dehydrogenase family)
MVQRFAEKVAVVTGGGGAMGGATVRRLVEEGARVAVGDIDEGALARLSDDLGDRIVTSRCDITVDEDTRALVAAAVESFGRLDVALNIAGGGGGGLVVEVEEAAWRSTIDLNINGTFLSIRNEARQMIAQGGGGAIVNVASVAARMPIPQMASYCVAKAGVEMLGRIAAAELGEHGIRVNTVSPGRSVFHDTDPLAAATADRDAHRTPLGRIGVPRDMASALLFLVSDDAAYISGAEVTVDGGFSTTSHLDLRDPYYRTVTRGS